MSAVTNYDYFLTGHASRICRSLKVRLTKLLNVFDEGKVGITNNPDRRARSYSGDIAMFVLYKTRSLEVARNVERTLIEHRWDDLLNQIGGGGGSYGQGPYYVYVVV